MCLIVLEIFRLAKAYILYVLICLVIFFLIILLAYVLWVQIYVVLVGYQYKIRSTHFLMIISMVDNDVILFLSFWQKITLTTSTKKSI